jgi:hypothetical protein
MPASLKISTAIAIRNARTGLSRAAAAIDHVAQVGRLFMALPPADTDLGYLSTAAVNTPSGQFTLKRQPPLRVPAHVRA